MVVKLNFYEEIGLQITFALIGSCIEGSLLLESLRGAGNAATGKIDATWGRTACPN